MSLKERYVELCEENDVKPENAVFVLQNMSEITERVRKLSKVDREQSEAVIDIIGDLGEILGYTADETRVSDEFRKEFDRDILDLAEKLEDELDSLEEDYDER